MKTITTVKELKDFASEVQGRDYVRAKLTDEMVGFLFSIYGKNRPFDAANTATIYRIVESGGWNEDVDCITVNKSCTWLVSGHHRVSAIKESSSRDIFVDVKIIDDERAERKFVNDDTILKKRTAYAQASLVYGTPNARDLNAIIRSYLGFKGQFKVTPSPDEIEQFWNIHKATLTRHGLTARIHAGDKSHPLTRGMYSLAVFLDETDPDKGDRMWELIDECLNEETENFTARKIREIILAEGSQVNGTPLYISMKYLAKGPQSGLKVLAHPSEIDGIKSRLGIRNVAEKGEVTKGSFGYFLQRKRRGLYDREDAKTKKMI